jgi:hypothetical protein
MKDKKEGFLKQKIEESDLSTSELQLKQLIIIRNELIKIKNDIHTIKVIVLIYFILGLIGALIILFGLASIL